jgi:hypothetical protein
VVTDLIDSWRDRPFEWGKSDCVRFASEAIEVLTGKPGLKQKEHVYKTAAEYKAAVSGGEMGRLIQERLFSLGFELVKRPSRACLAVIDMGKSAPALAVFDGQDLYMAGMNGAQRIETCTARQWWEYKLNQ